MTNYPILTDMVVAIAQSDENVPVDWPSNAAEIEVLAAKLPAAERENIVGGAYIDHDDIPADVQRVEEFLNDIFDYNGF